MKIRIRLGELPLNVVYKPSSPQRVMTLSSLLLLMLLVSGTDTARKRWVGEATWSEPNNWLNGLPSGCDVALIESNQILTIAAQANIAEISFSGDSAIIFDSFSEAAFGQGSYCNEVDSSIKFYEAERDDFLSVKNWDYYNEFEDLDVLDIHQIPCTHDIIELPYREMRAELRSPVEVGTVRYGGKDLSRGQVHDWLNSPEGRNELRMLSSFNLNEASYCKIRGGCECGNEASCNDTICRGSTLLCDNPIITPTMCCPFCGTLLALPVNYEKIYRQLELELSITLSHQNTPQKLKIGIEKGMLYLVLEQRGDRSTFDVSEDIMQRLILSNYTTYDHIEVQRSTAPVKADPIIHLTKVHTNSILLVVLGCIVFCLLLCGLILLYVVRRRTSNFTPMPVQRNDSHSQMGACNAYETLEPEQHIYEIIRVGRHSKSSDLDYYTEYSNQDKSDSLYQQGIYYSGDEQSCSCYDDNHELTTSMIEKQNKLTSV